DQPREVGPRGRRGVAPRRVRRVRRSRGRGAHGVGGAGRGRRAAGEGQDQGARAVLDLRGVLRGARADGVDDRGLMLRFVDRREIESVAQRAVVPGEQLRVAGILYAGDDLPGDARLAPDGDEGSFHGSCELWRIVDGDRHAYDAWFYMSDSGTIFRA